MQAQSSLKVGSKTIDLTKDGSYSVGGGTATFTKSNTTLTLKNVSLTDANISGNKVGTSSSALIIELESDLTIKHTINGMGMRFDYSYVTIKGNAHKITIDNSAVTSSGMPCIDAEESTLNVWNVSLDLKAGKSNAFWGNNSKATLSFSRVYGDFKGDAGAIQGFKSVTFSDCMLFTTGSKYVAGTGVTNASGTLLTYVEVRPMLMVGRMILRTASNSSEAGVGTWDKSTKTLTLGWDYKATSGYPCVANYGIDGLVIKFDEARTLTSVSANCIELYKATTFTGSGKLTVNAPDYYTGIYPMTAEATITIDGCNFAINGGYGIDGDGTSSNRTDLTIKNSTLTVTATTGTAMARLKSATLTGCCVNTAETPVFFNSSKQGFADISGEWTKKVVIGKPTTSYNVYVNGMRVNNLNQTNILVDGLTAGKMRYVDYSSYGYFELNKVTLTSNKSEAIKFSGFSKNVTIRCDGGTSTINQSNNDAIYGINCPKIRFEGDNKVVINVTTSNSAIRLFKTDLEVELKGLDVTSAGRGINAVDGSENVKLEKRYSSTVYNIKGTSGSLSYKTLTLEDLDFDANATPGCYAGAKYVCQNGGAEVKKNVRFSVPTTTYDFTVAGTPVNNCNMKGIGSQYITAGGGTAAVFDGTTLTLNGATIDPGTTSCCIMSYTDLTIDVKGNCTLKKPSGKTTTYLDGNTTIKGSGNLTVEGELWAIGNGCTLKLDDVNIKADHIDGSTTSSVTLDVDLKTAGKRIEVNGWGVTDFASLKLNTSKIIEPAGGKYDATQKCVVDATGTKVYKVIFGDKTATAIDGIEADTDAEVIGIYDVQGRKLDEMQPGINIIRMSNGTTKKVVK